MVVLFLESALGLFNNKANTGFSASVTQQLGILSVNFLCTSSYVYSTYSCCSWGGGGDDDDDDGKIK